MYMKYRDSPPNPPIEKCLDQIEMVRPVLDSMVIRWEYPDEITFKNEGSCWYHMPNITLHDYVAAFDMDWTLSYQQRALFPKSSEDIEVIPGRREVLEFLLKRGYTLAIFTNQYARNAKERASKLERVGNFLKKLELPCMVFVATAKDEYRKPGNAMWNKMVELVGRQIKHSFYVGDAMGRPQDFSDSDREFALAAGTEPIPPDEFFELSYTPVVLTNTLIVPVGMPGSGKSSFYRDNYAKDVVYVSKDDLKGNKKKFFKHIEDAMKKGKSVYADATNGKLDDRDVLYDLAEQYEYDPVTIYFVRDGAGWNALRGSDKVPTIAYHVYFKHLVPPVPENTPGELYFVT